MNMSSYEKRKAANGAVSFKGKSYALAADADLTNMVFPGWFGDAQEGEEYISKWSAPAVAENGASVRVFWEFTVTKGCEPEPDMHDWDDVSGVDGESDYE